jgi:adenylosuccinate synthase
MKVDVVIGSGYGDEGKGKTVDYLCTDKTLNVKFTGSAQAGHTVVAPDGFRHVFNTIGAGTLRGAKTFLAKDFIFNPLLYDKEVKAINNIHSNKLKFDPSGLIAHKDCLVTTPFDMIINQMIEKKRGINKHGSCGLGVNETIVRNQRDKYSTHFNDNERILMDSRYHRIRDKYLPVRIAQLGLSSADLPDYTFSRDLINDFHTITYNSTAKYHVPNHWIISEYHHIVFEGSQGLMLDKNHRHFPYVTNGNTGLNNVLAILEELRYNKPLNIYYVTRPYKTRHGVGPLEHETNYFDFIEDKTNVKNEWQDSLRFGFLDFNILKDEIHRDINKLKGIKNHNYYLVINCLDQVEEFPIYRDGEITYTNRDEFPKILIEYLNTKNVKFNCLIGDGETRNDMREWR